MAQGAAPAPAAHTIEHQGVPRAALVVNAASAPKPLLIVLHGRRDASVPNRSSPMLDALAQRDGFVVAYPAGLEGRWNFPQQAMAPVMAGTQPADDAGFVVGLIDTLIAAKVADPKRVYVSGASNGGLLTYGLMCLASDRIAAAAPLIANMSEAQFAACKPNRAVPMVAVAGTADRIMPYDGTFSAVGQRLASIPETMEFWRKQHGCAAQTVAYPAKTVPLDPTVISTIDWTGCATLEGHVRLYRVEAGGHTLPSRTPQPTDDLARNGRRSAELETAEAVWDFLKQWSLP